MFKLHKKVKYAISALKYMKNKPVKSLSTAKEICLAYKIPFDPTSRVLQIMTQEKILKAEQGAHGGYRLVGNLDKVTLYSLSRMVIGPIAVTDCTSETPVCGRLEECVLKDEMAWLNARLVKMFKAIKLSEMV